MRLQGDARFMSRGGVVICIQLRYYEQCCRKRPLKLNEQGCSSPPPGPAISKA